MNPQLRGGLRQEGITQIDAEMREQPRHADARMEPVAARGVHRRHAENTAQADRDGCGDVANEERRKKLGKAHPNQRGRKKAQREKTEKNRHHSQPSRDFGRQPKLPHQGNHLRDWARPGLQHARALGLQHQLIKIAQSRTFPLDDQRPQRFWYGGWFAESEQRAQLQPVNRQITSRIKSLEREPSVRVNPLGDVRV